MAMRGALTHRKTRRLARIMGIAQPFALGLMEALWHVTAEQAPTGAIGRLSNKDIAEEMFWEGDADALIDALLASELLERHSQFRLIVHNYHKYADQATKRKVERHGLEFAVSDGECLVMASQQLDVTGLPVPVPDTSTRDQSPVAEPAKGKKIKDPKRTWDDVVGEMVEIAPEALHGIISEFCHYRAERKDDPLTPIGARAWVAKYQKWPANDLIDTLNHVMLSNWKGIPQEYSPGNLPRHISRQNGQANGKHHSPAAITIEQAQAMLTGEGLEDRGSPIQRRKPAEGQN